MALDWDAFLLDEAFNIPDDQWPDITTPSTHLTLEMPKSSSTRTSGSAEPGVDFDSLLNGTSADPYFNDALFAPNDYFLSDLEVLQPFAKSSTAADSIPLTSENSVSFNRVAQMPLMQKPSTSRANTFPNPQYESLFPNNLERGFVEDLTFPHGPDGPNRSSNSSKTATENKISTGTTTKRAHKAKADIISACWTSPLCPNHDQDGPPPNPSSCGGGCAPFLFANDDTLPTSTIHNLLNEAQEVIPEDGVVEIMSRSHSKKRSESEISADEPLGRQFASGNSIDTEQNSQVKSESEDSPQAQTAEDKAKPRRRLPHNQVERKYRESLNTQLESLRRVVPSLQQNQRGCDGADIEDLPAPSKPSKAVILASATAHIKNIEKDKKALQDENQLLKTRIKALQALVKCEDCSLMQYVMDLKINQQK
ncbi:hypothetical protein P171DRAFT_145551 [Karstenula rhodostoma CBS 690.94]|uniref:BHLH domain-containing protein n=1 Tax=Karstenula rhodostoma CBS 690.94 TaxID=1392251 RepID=A0A9P4UIX0_9PLEO|nr:hypothetical protein P171DRAFT_145551 [Karstenula rhodostoma CBS 690.94]